MEGRMELEIRFSDGRGSIASGQGPPRQLIDYYTAAGEGRTLDPPAGPIVTPGSGSAGGKRAEFKYWVWPLPPGGPLTISCGWRAAGVAQREVELDGAAIQRAGASSQDLWK